MEYILRKLSIIAHPKVWLLSTSYNSTFQKMQDIIWHTLDGPMYFFANVEHRNSTAFATFWNGATFNLNYSFLNFLFAIAPTPSCSPLPCQEPKKSHNMRQHVGLLGSVIFLGYCATWYQQREDLNWPKQLSLHTQC